jgi:hypothetical protein
MFLLYDNDEGIYIGARTKTEETVSNNRTHRFSLFLKLLSIVLHISSLIFISLVNTSLALAFRSQSASIFQQQHILAK